MSFLHLPLASHVDTSIFLNNEAKVKIQVANYSILPSYVFVRSDKQGLESRDGGTKLLTS